MRNNFQLTKAGKHCFGRKINYRGKQHPRAYQNTQQVFDEQPTRAGRNTQPLTKLKKLIK